MSKIIHTMIRVLDLERSMRFYASAFGMRESHRLDFPDFALVYLRNDDDDFEIELTLNKGRVEPYTHGSGYGHVAVVVDDVAADRERVAALGQFAREARMKACRRFVRAVVQQHRLAMHLGHARGHRAVAHLGRGDRSQGLRDAVIEADRPQPIE